MSAAPRSRNPTYLIGAGIIVSILGVIMVILLLSQPGTVPFATRPVLVVSQAVPAHTKLTADDLTLAQFPTNIVPDGALNSPSQATGRFTVAAMPKGQPITADLLAATAQAAVSAGVDIPTGEVAVVVPPSDARNLVSGLVQNGDRVDILANGLPGQSGGQLATTFTDLVIQVVPGSTAGTPTQWIVYLSLTRAEQLQYLLLNGQYHFVVRSRKDTGAEQAAPPVGRDEFNGAFNIH